MFPRFSPFQPIRACRSAREPCSSLRILFHSVNTSYNPHAIAHDRSRIRFPSIDEINEKHWQRIPIAGRKRELALGFSFFFQRDAAIYKFVPHRLLARFLYPRNKTRDRYRHFAFSDQSKSSFSRGLSQFVAELDFFFLFFFFFFLAIDASLRDYRRKEKEREKEGGGRNLI